MPAYQYLHLFFYVSLLEGTGIWRKMKIFFKNVFIFNWRIIAVRAVLVSAIQQRESVIGIHMFPPSWTSLPPPTTSHPSRSS